jgi:protein-disulfide isomerase
MENNTPTPQPQQQALTMPVAIVIAAVLVLIAVVLVNNRGGASTKVVAEKTLSEQVGVAKDKLTACIAATDQNALGAKLQASVDAAMKGVPADQRGTPYSVLVGTNGVKTEIRGADTLENVNKLIAEVNSGTVTTKYTGDVPPVDPATDHILGNLATAKVTIIEYSDYECPYCARFDPVLQQVISDSNGSVAWVYRHWPIHQNSMAKLVAAECVAQLKGNDAFWKYSDLLFKLIAPVQAPVADQL